MFSLDQERGDLIAIYKILTDMDQVDSQNLIPILEVSEARGHRSKMGGRSFKVDLRRKFLYTESD